MALFIFDKDGTLIGNREGGNRPPNTPDQQYVLPNVAEKIAELRAAGHNIAIASNQGGVAWGFISEDDVQALMRDVEFKLGAFDCIEWCCYDWRARGAKGAHPRYSTERHLDAQMRKPAPGMLLAIMQYAFPQEIPPSETIFVGDADSDREAAQRAGVRFIWAKEFFGW